MLSLAYASFCGRHRFSAFRSRLGPRITLMRQPILFICLFIAAAAMMSCREQSVSPTKYESTAPRLTIDQANRFAKLPMKCVAQEYPNKLNQTIVGPDELQSPKALHPSFYGCFDWHSSVHGHWVLIKLLNDFPDLENKAEIQARLVESLSK